MQSQGALSFTDLVFNASFLVQCVMLFLLGLSIASWTIIISRNNQYRVGRAKADAFEDRFWSGIDLNNLYQECMKRPDDLVGLEVIYSAGFKEFVRLVNSGPADQEVVMDGTYRQMKVACSREVELLENHLPTLATIGSISPYIGLFGTVWGIMHAFVALAAVKNATLAMVAPPIAEALIATAMGLFAAIPAVMFYNRFVTKVEALENRYYNFMDEFSTILNRRLVTIRSQLNRQTGVNPADAAPMAQMEQNVAPVSQGNVASQMGSSPNGNDLSAMNNMSALNPSAQTNDEEYQADFDDDDFEEVPVRPVSSVSVSAPAQTSSAANAQAARQTRADGNSSEAQGLAKAIAQGRPAANQANRAQANARAQQAQARRPQQHGLSGVSASHNQALNPAALNDQNMAAFNRGVVPPRNPNVNAQNAQLPGGPASAMKPNATRTDGPNYRTGPEVDSRTLHKNDEPQYITPGANRRRPAASQGDGRQG